MKFCFFLSALVVLGGLAANAGYAKLNQTTPRSVAKPTPTSSLASAGLRRGSVGGPVNKVAGINGTVGRQKH